MELSLCRHIKTNGIRCKAPSLTGGLWCCFHQRLHNRHTAYRFNEATRGYLLPGKHIELSPLEDRESIQVALSVVINALATGGLETKRATALLYGLQLASNNARGLRTEPSETVLSADSSPEGIDLAEPDTFEHAPALFFEDDLEDALDREHEEYRKELIERMEARCRAHSNSEAPPSDATPASADRSPE
jgi:hypothetical protein